jgi:(p)ppGpp synthase/HD superfamily hydrolase
MSMTATPWSQDAFQQASWFAGRAHLGQTLPGSDVSYVLHLSQVSMEVMAALSRERFENGDLAVQCALLHDVIEDTAVTVDELAAEFSEAVVNGVLALTKNTQLAGGKPEWMRDSLARIREQPHEVWLVKLADRVTNLQVPPAYWTPEKIAYYRIEAQEIHAALGDASPYLGQRLHRSILRYNGD